MKHTKSIVAIAFTALVILAACSHKSTPTTAAVPQQAPAQFNMVAASTTSVAEGEKTYNAKCGKCHELKKASEYTSSEWRPIMRSMADKAKLTEQEKTNVLAYVINGAKSGK